jgi:DNA-binding NarL/FixJ family response regulator
MDIRMPGRDGVSATAAIAADPALSGTRVIVLTTFDLDEYVHAALRAGASGFLLKDAQPTDLLAAVHRCSRGGTDEPGLEFGDQFLQLIVAKCHSLECRQGMHRHRPDHLDDFWILQDQHVPFGE